MRLGAVTLSGSLRKPRCSGDKAGEPKGARKPKTRPGFDPRGHIHQVCAIPRAAPPLPLGKRGGGCLAPGRVAKAKERAGVSDLLLSRGLTREHRSTAVPVRLRARAPGRECSKSRRQCPAGRAETRLARLRNRAPGAGDATRRHGASCGGGDRAAESLGSIAMAL